MAGDSNPDRVVAGFVEPAADTVLAEGLDVQPAITVGHGRLDRLLQYAGFHPASVYFSGDMDMCFLTHLDAPVSHHVFDLKPLGRMMIVDTQGIGHADGQRRGPSQRVHDFFQFRIET